MSRRVIPSEGQAEQIGMAATGGIRDRDFTVFQYDYKSAGLTLFGVEIAKTKQVITTFNP